ncbi:MAG TPA: 30S ribosomal protein S8 [Candidatus Saccharimonadales bacterium]|nr:30S ribosomal protein S8 [Candidatus Saccharimonadales bacterium]
MTQVSTDPIADMLTRIRNAIAVRKTQVNLPHSKAKEAVAHLLKQNGFIDDVSVSDAPVGKTLRLSVSNKDGNAHITEIVRLSKPGRRHYAGAKDIPTVKRGRGIVIISTSKGMMTGDQAKQQGVGGELICKVY